MIETPVVDECRFEASTLFDPWIPRHKTTWTGPEDAQTCHPSNPPVRSEPPFGMKLGECNGLPNATQRYHHIRLL